MNGVQRSPSPSVRTRDLSLWYGQFQALKDVSVDIAAGAITGLIGPSGCGKSTFLRCFNRLNERSSYVRFVTRTIVISASSSIAIVSSGFARWTYTASASSATANSLGNWLGVPEVRTRRRRSSGLISRLEAATSAKPGHDRRNAHARATTRHLDHDVWTHGAVSLRPGLHEVHHRVGPGHTDHGHGGCRRRACERWRT